MKSSVLLRSTDIEALLALVGELHELRSQPIARRREHALQRLCQLLSARVGGYTVHRWESLRTPRGWTEEITFHGFRPDEDRFMASFLNDPARCLDNPVAKWIMARLRRRPDRPVLADRDRLMKRSKWYGHPYVQDILRVADIDAFVGVAALEAEPASSPTRANGSATTFRYLVLRREWRARPFDGRARALLALAHSATGSLLADSSPPRADAASHGCACSLPPRQRQILEALLSGASEKEIARELGRSRHTVHRHVTSLYRRHGVSSRAELMALFLSPRKAIS